MRATLGPCRRGLLDGRGTWTTPDPELASLRMTRVSLETANLPGPLTPIGFAKLLGAVATTWSTFLTRLLTHRKSWARLLPLQTATRLLCSVRMTKPEIMWLLPTLTPGLQAPNTWMTPIGMLRLWQQSTKSDLV